MLEVECSKVGGTFCTDMGVQGFPTIVLAYKDKYMKYGGARIHGAMIEFLGDESKWIMEDLPANVAKFLPVAVTQPKIAKTEPQPPAVVGGGNEEL
jgi:hypothetical protein